MSQLILLLALIASVILVPSADAQTPTWKNDALGRPAPPCFLLSADGTTTVPCSAANPIPTSGAGAGLGTTGGTSTTGFGKQWFPSTVTGSVASGQGMQVFFDSNLGSDTNTVVFLRRSTTCGNCLQVAISTDGGVTGTFFSTALNIANTLQVARRIPSSPPRYLVSADNGATAVIASSPSLVSGWTASTGLAAGDSLADAQSNATGSTVLATINENANVCRSTNQGQAFVCAAGGGGNGGGLAYAGGTVWLRHEGAAGDLRRSIDDGLTWSLVTSFGTNAQGVRCLSPTFTTCIVLNANGNISRSTDAGLTWPTIPLSGLGAGGFAMCEAQANSPAGSGVFSILGNTPPVGFAAIAQNAFSSFNAGVAWFTGQSNGSPWDGTGAPGVNGMDCRNGKGAAVYSTTGGGVNVFAMYNPLTQPGGVLQSSAGGYSIAAPIQAGIILNAAPTVSAANTAAVVTLTNTAGSRVCIRIIAVKATGAAATFTLTVSDGGTTVLDFGTQTAALNGAADVLTGTPLICSQTNNNLVVNIGAGGVGAITTTSVIADRYPN